MLISEFLKRNDGELRVLSSATSPEWLSQGTKSAVLWVLTWTPTFAKLSIHDCEKVKIAAIHPDFE